MKVKKDKKEKKRKNEEESPELFSKKEKNIFSLFILSI